MAIILLSPGSTITVGNVTVTAGDLGDLPDEIFDDGDTGDRSGPITDEQRAALFAAMRDVFGDYSSAQRYAVTRLTLGLPPDATVSWSRYDGACLTHDEASRVLDTLALLNV